MAARRRKPKFDKMQSPPKTDVITYKDVYRLKKYTSVRGKLISRAKSGLTANQQRQLSKAVKIARYLALLPFVNTGESNS